MEPTHLLIGYGNTLRGDDGAGPRLAEAVAEWKLPHVRVLVRQTLTPELADDIHRAQRVLFVDACPGIERIVVKAIASGPGSSANGHVSDPAVLLKLAHDVYGTCPEAWLLMLPAVNFAMGEHLSPLAQTGIVTGLVWVRDGWLPVRS